MTTATETTATPATEPASGGTIRQAAEAVSRFAEWFALAGLTGKPETRSYSRDECATRLQELVAVWRSASAAVPASGRELVGQLHRSIVSELRDAAAAESRRVEFGLAVIETMKRAAALLQMYARETAPGGRPRSACPIRDGWACW